MELTGKELKEVKAILQERIRTVEPIFTLKILEIIYNNQTNDEKGGGYTKHSNGKGFSGYDANFLTSIYLLMKRGGILSEKQKIIVAKLLPKYWKQSISALSEEEIVVLKRRAKLEKLLA